MYSRMRFSVHTSVCSAVKFPVNSLFVGNFGEDPAVSVGRQHVRSLRLKIMAEVERSTDDCTEIGA
jgi:hypothetical protein